MTGPSPARKAARPPCERECGRGAACSVTIAWHSAARRDVYYLCPACTAAVRGREDVRECAVRPLSVTAAPSGGLELR